MSYFTAYHNGDAWLYGVRTFETAEAAGKVMHNKGEIVMVRMPNAEREALLAVAEQANVVTYSMNARQSTSHWAKVSTMHLHLLQQSLNALAAVRSGKAVAS